MAEITDMGDWLETFNPFGIKGKGGRVQMFPRYADCYLHTLKELRQECKRGYIDFPVFMEHLTGFDKATCMQVNEYGMKTSGLLREDFMLIDWENIKSSDSEAILCAILKTLHNVTETEFVYNMFELAMVEFEPWLKTYNKKHEQD